MQELVICDGDSNPGNRNKSRKGFFHCSGVRSEVLGDSGIVIWHRKWKGGFCEGIQLIGFDFFPVDFSFLYEMSDEEFVK